MIWFTSDLHLNHDREFVWKKRGFGSVSEMNKEIIKRWNEVIDIEDDVYLLGDVMLGNNEDGIKLLKMLKGNIHIILGNHDTDSRVEMFNRCWNVVEICYASVIKYGRNVLYLSHYPTMVGNKNDDKHHQLLNLYGHTHQEDNFYNGCCFMYHVGVDSHNCMPVKIDDIIEEIKEKRREMYGDN